MEKIKLDRQTKSATVRKGFNLALDGKYLTKSVKYKAEVTSDHQAWPQIHLKKDLQIIQLHLEIQNIKKVQTSHSIFWN